MMSSKNTEPWRFGVDRENDLASGDVVELVDCVAHRPHRSRVSEDLLGRSHVGHVRQRTDPHHVARFARSRQVVDHVEDVLLGQAGVAGRRPQTEPRSRESTQQGLAGDVPGGGDIDQSPVIVVARQPEAPIGLGHEALGTDDHLGASHGCFVSPLDHVQHRSRGKVGARRLSPGDGGGDRRGRRGAIVTASGEDERYRERDHPTHARHCGDIPIFNIRIKTTARLKCCRCACR